jgi:hypothetical protein
MFVVVSLRFCCRISVVHISFLSCLLHSLPTSSVLSWSFRSSAQVTKILIKQFFPALYYFTSLRTKYSPQHPVFMCPHSISPRNTKVNNVVGNNPLTVFWYVKPYSLVDVNLLVFTTLGILEYNTNLISSPASDGSRSVYYILIP